MIGPRDEDGTTFQRAWTTIWRPFSRQAWVLLFLIAVFVVVMRIWIAYHFTIPWSWHQFHDNFLGDYEHAQVYSELGRGRVARFRDPFELRRLNSYLSNGSKIVFVIVILYYEISIVNFVFFEHRERSEKLVPEQFVIMRNNMLNHKFKEYVKDQEFRNCFDGNRPCWKQVDSVQEVYDTITTRGGIESDQYRYSAVYETMNRYQFKENASFCKELQVLDYVPLNSRVTLAWYYSSNIPVVRRTEMDMAITRLREKNQIRRFINDVSGSKLPGECVKKDHIDVLQLGMPLFLFSSPIFMAVFFYMMLYSMQWRNVGETEVTDESDEVEKSKT